jgi:hypothetical protein
MVQEQEERDKQMKQAKAERDKEMEQLVAEIKKLKSAGELLITSLMLNIRQNITAL